MELKFVRQYWSLDVSYRLFRLEVSESEFELLKPYTHHDTFETGEMYLKEEQMHKFMRDTGIEIFNQGKPIPVFDEEFDFKLESEYDKMIIDVCVMEE
jgi:hypothetical protein